MVPSVLVIGAGMTGLTAARSLRAAGLRVEMVDKGRAVGGRMATRRIGEATFDHGAQHVSARTDAFAPLMRELVAEGVAWVWLQTPSITHPDRGVEDRFAGVGGMRRIPEAMAAGLDIATGVTVDRLSFDDHKVSALCGVATVAVADAVILTPPLPQTLTLLEASGVANSPLRASLAETRYASTLVAMATLDAPADLPDGHLAFADGPVAWIADNHQKGVSAVPALTIHSSAEFAHEHLESDPNLWMAALLAAARPQHSGEVLQAASHRWRYAQPLQARADGAVVAEADAPVVLAGEAFAGARVEGAHTSGLAAAALVQELLS